MLVFRGDAKFNSTNPICVSSILGLAHTNQEYQNYEKYQTARREVKYIP